MGPGEELTLDTMEVAPIAEIATSIWSTTITNAQIAKWGFVTLASTIGWQYIDQNIIINKLFGI